jgi:site-specific DNA-adenine methylase
MNYGMPYMGSKSKIAEWVVSNLPSADIWIEPFAGGCAVTHAAILSGKYKHFIINDITDSAATFLCAIKGGFKNENRWISREDFFRLKNTDPYVRICFSFGNDQKTYCYGDIEPYKRAFHYAVMFNDFKPFAELGILIPDYVLNGCKNTYEKRLRIKKILIQIRKDKHAGDLQSLERLQSLQRLQSLGNLESLQGDYKTISIPTDKSYVIYCDPPYKNTSSYLDDFNHEDFYKWALKQDNCYISEYNMPDSFVRIALKSKLSLKAATGNRKIKEEGIWVSKENVNRMSNVYMPLFKNFI